MDLPVKFHLRATTTLLLIAVAIILVESNGSERTAFEETKQTEQNDLFLSNYTSKDYCGKHRARKHRIAGGFPATKGEFPSFAQVILTFDNGVGHCGGAIISEWLVLTAAHCLQKSGSQLKHIEIRVGCINRNSGRKLKVARWCNPDKIPNSYDSKNDLYTIDSALLVMEEAIKFGPLVRPACLPSSTIDPDRQAYAVGFGHISGEGKHADKLQSLPVKKVPKCRWIRDKLMAACFESNNPNYVGDFCAGDSGGPVYMDIDGKQTVVATISSGKSNCEAGNTTESVTMNVFALMKLKRLDTIITHCEL